MLVVFWYFSHKVCADFLLTGSSCLLFGDTRVVQVDHSFSFSRETLKNTILDFYFTRRVSKASGDDFAGATEDRPI